MNRPTIKAVSIATHPDQATLSKGQKAFNALIKQIEKKRVRLEAWENAMPPYHQKYLSEWVPLIEASADLRTKLVVCLDGAYDQKGFTKTERRTIEHQLARPENRASLSGYSFTLHAPDNRRFISLDMLGLVVVFPIPDAAERPSRWARYAK